MFREKYAILTLINKRQKALLISDKTDFKGRQIIRHKEGYCIMIRLNSQKNTIILTCKCLKQSSKLCEAKTIRTARRNR